MTVRGCLRNFDLVKDLFDDVIRGHILCFRFVGQEHAVTQNVGADLFDIIWGHIAATLEEGVSLRGQG